MNDRPNRLEAFLDFIGDRLEVRHLIGAPFAIIALACIHFNGWMSMPVNTIFIGFLYPFFCPRRWLWIGYVGWAIFGVYLALQPWKDPVITRLVFGGASIGLIIAATVSFRTEK